MLRVALIDIVMFALPFVAYAIWLKTSRPGQEGQSIWSGAPLFTLAGIGIALVVAAMAVLISFSGREPGGVYKPPTFKDGKVQPGHFE